LSFVMNYWHQSYILSLFCGPRRKGAQRQEDCNMRVEKEVNLFQIYNMGSGNAMWLDFHVDPNKLSFLQSYSGNGKIFGARTQEEGLI
ncbi:hypothetical protein S83_066823, partial [Arachis hypogaea]